MDQELVDWLGVCDRKFTERVVSQPMEHVTASYSKEFVMVHQGVAISKAARERKDRFVDEIYKLSTSMGVFITLSEFKITCTPSSRVICLNMTLDFRYMPRETEILSLAQSVIESVSGPKSIHPSMNQQGTRTGETNFMVLISGAYKSVFETGVIKQVREKFLQDAISKMNAFSPAKITVKRLRLPQQGSEDYINVYISLSV